MGRMDGKVAVISGAARGQGRAHAVTLAREGASIVAFDTCDAFKHVLYPPATEADLEETARLVEAHGRPCLAVKADARDLRALTDLAADTVSRFGRIDALVVNHGIWAIAANSWELEEESWQESIDVLLSGAWKVVKAFVPHMLDNEDGGAIVLTSSGNGVRPQPGAIAYSAAKAGIINMMKVLAWELGPHRIRVNTVNPGAVETDMALGGTVELSMKYWPRFWEDSRSLLPNSTQPPQSIADAVLWLVSDEAQYVTGISVPVDSGRAAF